MGVIIKTDVVILYDLTYPEGWSAIGFSTAKIECDVKLNSSLWS